MSHPSQPNLPLDATFALPFEVDLATLRPSLALTVQLCHQANKNWWLDPVSKLPVPVTKELILSKLMLIVSEIGEACEGVRKDLQDDHLPQFTSLEVELADAMIRLMDLSGALGLRLADAWEEKMRYNAQRLDHSLAHRSGPGGKKV